ncbi:MAG: histidine phosphatase family protein [Luteimonas sp.]|nr:histidine phosphatase family protein [Luteimonas sp.]
MYRFLLAACCCLLLLPAHAAEPQSPAARTIVLVRHGNYAENPSADERLGPGLSPLGVAQARLAGARLAALPLHFDRLLASPLQRARDTAAVIAGDFPGRTFTIDDDLAECTPPTRRADIMAREKPEALTACKAQLERAFARYFVPAAGGASADLLVCHANVIRYLVTRALGVDSTAWLAMSVGHASLTTIRVNADGSFKVLAVGDTGYIPPNLSTNISGDPARDLVAPPLPLAPAPGG